MEYLFNQFNKMTTEDPRCIDVTALFSDVEYFGSTGEIRFTPRFLSDFELDFIVNDLVKNSKIQLSENFIEKYLSLRQEPELIDNSGNSSDTEDTTKDYSNSYPTYVAVGVPEEVFADDEGDDDPNITDYSIDDGW